MSLALQIVSMIAEVLLIPTWLDSSQGAAVCYSFSCSKPGPLRISASIIASHISLYYSFNPILWCFRHKQCVKTICHLRANVLVLAVILTWRVGALDCGSCSRQQLVRAWIIPLALPGGKEQPAASPQSPPSCSADHRWRDREREFDREQGD